MFLHIFLSANLYTYFFINLRHTGVWIHSKWSTLKYCSTLEFFFRPLQLESNYLKFSVVPCTRGVFPGILPGSVPASNLPVLVHGHGNQEICQEKNYIPFKFITRFVSFCFLMGLKSINLNSNIKGVTMRAIFSNPAGWRFIDSNGWKKIKFWRKNFFPPKLLRGKHFFRL